MVTTRRAAAAATVVFIAFLAVELSGRLNDHSAEIFSRTTFAVLGLAYLPLTGRAARAAHGRLRAAWIVMGIGLASWLLGDVLTIYYELHDGQAVFPNWSDAAYLAFLPLTCVALLLFPTARNWRRQSELILDAVVVTGSTFLISWLTVLRGIWQGGRLHTLEFAVTMAYPAGEFLVVTVGLLVLIRVTPGLRPTLGLLVAGLVVEWLADSRWAYEMTTAGFSAGSLPRIFYAANTLLIIVALVAAQHARQGAVGAAVAPSLLTLWLPLLPAAVAGVFVVATEPAVVMEAPVMVTGTVLVAAALLRQFMESAELIRRESRIRHLADRLTEDLESASRYVASILPSPLRGPVEVNSRYLPAQAVGGDSFGYQWIDDDHLIFYIIDVAGHGVRPALLSVSVHNLLRSGGLPVATLLKPDQVLAELNTRFSMDDHDDHYFTMWFGVYRLSAGQLRYANGGHPPPIVLTVLDDTVDCATLAGESLPLGMFPDTEFAVETCTIPPEARILLYSDGVLGEPPNVAEFTALCAALAAAAPSLDSLIARLPPSDDDRSLVLLTFPRVPRPAASRSPDPGPPAVPVVSAATWGNDTAAGLPGPDPA